MATWVIGDLQGCYSSLRQLLKRIKYRPDRDRLWFCGDLVSRGEQSLEALRFVRSLDDGAITVLGNHDLHLLALAEGARRRKPSRDLRRILDAKDSGKLLKWLRRRPLLHHDRKLGFTLVHAGLAPQWKLKTARACAREAEAALRKKSYPKLLAKMYGNKPDLWSNKLTGYARLRFIINVFTRLRYCAPSGRLRLELKGPPQNHPRSIPWFEFPGRASQSKRIVFGHWSTLNAQESNNTWCVDGGCVWGGRLVALRLDRDPPKWRRVKCKQQARPG